MRRGIVIFLVIMMLSGIVLAVYSPDMISIVFVAAMLLLLLLGIIFGISRLLRFSRGFQTAVDTIDQSIESNTGSSWAMIKGQQHFFNQPTMDETFQEYQEKVIAQRSVGQILSDIEDYYNEDYLGIHSWQNLVMQIPGSLTGFGILGTFIGLIIGVRGIEFNTVNSALLSVQRLLAGIQTAFYTSITGVILSLMFNFAHRFAWNLAMRNLGLFTMAFHKSVIPPVTEQTLYRERREINQVIELLERLPKNQGFSLSAGGGAAAPVSSSNEQILMPQILAGLREGEFAFQLQPRYRLDNRAVVGAEALVRWNHSKLGTISPAVFVPILENNGSITKLDQYIWESVCMQIRKWMDEGKRPVPISINITKTDILAMDVAKALLRIVKKYDIPPMNLEIEIAENAYITVPQATVDTEANLRRSGFKVVVDGFLGNFLDLSMVNGFSADTLKLDLRMFEGRNNQSVLSALFAQAQKLQMSVTAGGIESMEQLTMLRKAGCTVGQGFYLSVPLSPEEFDAQGFNKGRK